MQKQKLHFSAIVFFLIMMTFNNLFAQDHIKKMVDKYGQLTDADFVARVTSDSQLILNAAVCLQFNVMSL